MTQDSRLLTVFITNILARKHGKYYSVSTLGLMVPLGLLEPTMVAHIPTLQEKVRHIIEMVEQKDQLILEILKQQLNNLLYLLLGIIKKIMKLFKVLVSMKITYI